LEAKDILQRDEIYEFLRKQGQAVSAEKIFSMFYDKELSSKPKKIVQKTLSSDTRFVEKPSGMWSTEEYQGDDTPVSKLRYCVFDLETTGGVPPLHRIIEIGAVLIEDGEIVDEFQSFVNPERPLPDYITRLTGIVDDDLTNAPTIGLVLQEFMEFSKGCVYVAHGSLFDVNFVDFELSRLFRKHIEGQNLCTLKLSKFFIQDSKSHKLDDLAEYYDISFGNRHRALDDSRVTGEVFLHLLKMFVEQYGDQSFDQMRKFSIHVQKEHFPSCLASPELLSELPEKPGNVFFWGKNGKRIGSLPLANIKKGMKELFYVERGSSRLFKRLRKAVRFDVKVENCLLKARLQAGKQHNQKASMEQEPIYLKFFDPNSAKLLVTNRKLNDEAFYFGPIPENSKILNELKNDYEQVDSKEWRFPPKSGVQNVFALPKENAMDVCHKWFSYSNKDADFVTLVQENEDERMQFLFVREGFVVKSRRFLKEGLCLPVVKNFFRQVFQRYYEEISIKQIMGKKTKESLRQYNTVMYWLENEASKEENCTTVILSHYGPELIAEQKGLDDVLNRLLPELFEQQDS
jgi:DNA polymerase III epsilon subunit family exonuclease